MIKCPDCGSTSIYKRGFRHNKSGTLRVYSCRKCSTIFTDSDNIRGMKHSFHDINRVMEIWSHTSSYSEIKRKAEKEGIKVSEATIRKWSYKYCIDYDLGQGLWGGEV